MVMFGMLDWSDMPAADQALQRALEALPPRLCAGLARLETPRLALAGLRQVRPFRSLSKGRSGNIRSPRSWSDETSWLLIDAAASAGEVSPADLDHAETEPANVARRIADSFRGDFAVAWWNAKQRSLMLIRDAMGLKPLFYHQGPTRVLFSSSLVALRAALPAAHDVDHVFIARMLCLDTEVRNRTGWRDFHRVPAGGHVVLGRDHLRPNTGRWWWPELGSRPAEPQNGAWPAALRERLLSAVAIRLPENPRSVIASYLSGGLDSSSVVGALREVVRDRGISSEIHSLSFQFPGLGGLEKRQSDETRYQTAVNDFVNATPHAIRADLSSPLRDLDRFLQATSEPWVAPNRYLHFAGLSLAKDVGASVVFDGIDGDSAIGYGVERFEELARSLRWLQLLRQARRLARNAPGRRHTVRSIMREYALPGLLPRPWRRWRDIRQDRQRLLGRMQLLSPSLRRRDDVQEELRARSLIPAGAPGSMAHRHAAGLRLSIHELATSQLQHLAAANGLRIAFPFFDRELLELSLAIPLEQKLHNGWLRYVLREAIAGLVPEEVRWRRDKSNLAPQFYRGLMITDRSFAQTLLSRSESALEPYVDIDVLRDASHDLFEREDRSQAMPVLAVITLARWLELRDEGVV